MLRSDIRYWYAVYYYFFFLDRDDFPFSRCVFRKPPNSRASLAAWLICLNLSGPRWIPPKYLVTTTNALSVCLKQILARCTTSDYGTSLRMCWKYVMCSKTSTIWIWIASVYLILNAYLKLEKMGQTTTSCGFSVVVVIFCKCISIWSGCPAENIPW